MLKILIVDDSLVARKKIADAVIELGHEIVAEASSGKEAIKAYVRNKPDLVTMDIIMSDMDGIKAMEFIFKTDKNAKFVMISSLSQVEMVEKSVHLGAIGYILKPISKEKLAQVIKEIHKDKQDEK